MQLYRLKNKEIPWGDYGDILLSGIIVHPNNANDNLQYKRTGPFQPNIIIAGLDNLLVTESTKQKIEASNLKGFNFKPVVKQHISIVDWTNWNLKNEHPDFYPTNNDPENYILDLPHSQQLANKMENVWEVIVEQNGVFVDSKTFIPGNKNIDIMRTQNSGWFLVTNIAKNWLQQNCDAWIEFWDLENLPY
jgi:hypothetical protein